MRRRSVAGLLFVGFVSLAATAPEDQAAPPTQLVDLNVVALDAKGEPVRDLKIEEFQVFDNGKPQSIVDFRHFDAVRLQSAPLEPGEYSNRIGGNVAHATVILFDLLNQVIGDQGFTMTQLVRYLETLETCDDLYLYLLTVDGHLYSVHPLPPAGVPSASAAQWTRQIRPVLEQALEAVSRVRPAEIDVLGRVNLTFRALEALATRMSAIPGHKNLVWLTHGVPVSLSGTRARNDEPVDFMPSLRNLSDRLDQAHVAIYPVQLSSPGMTNSTTREPQIQGGRGGQPDAATGSNPSGLGTGTALGSKDTLEEFAGLTGGRAPGNNNIGNAIGQAMSDAQTSYQIGYYTQPQNWDGKYHKLRVTCTRKGVRIQNKQGYYAWPPQDSNSEEKDAFAATSVAQFDSGEIGLRAQVSPGAGVSSAFHLRMVVNVEDVLFAHNQQRYTAQLSVMFAGYMTDGSTAEIPANVINLSLNPEEHDQTLRDGVVMGRDLRPAGLRAIRVIVYDRGSHATGSVTIPIGPSVP